MLHIQDNIINNGILTGQWVENPADMFMHDQSITTIMTHQPGVERQGKSKTTQSYENDLERWTN